MMGQKKYNLDKIREYKKNKSEFIGFRLSEEESLMLKKLMERSNISDKTQFMSGMIRMLYESEFSQIYN